MTSFIVICTIAASVASGANTATHKMVVSRSVSACHEWANQNHGKIEDWIRIQLPLYQNRYEGLCGPDGADCTRAESRS